MGNDTMDLQGLASFLRRDARELSKLASQGHLPGRKVRGEWRFDAAEIHHWMERQFSTLSDAELRSFESHGSEVAEPIVASLLLKSCIALPLRAGTKGSVLRELVKLAEQSYLIYDADAIRDAVAAREELASTALDVGVAIPHPHRRLTNALGDSVIAFARTATGIGFVAPRGGTTDLFFLVCCADDATHLRVLARLALLVRQPGLLDELRTVETPAEAWERIDAAERELLGL